MDGLRALEQFDPDQDPNTVGKAWAIWKRNFNFWAQTKAFTNKG
jgi:hypothetical protein